MITVLVYRSGRVERAESVDPAWLEPGARVIFWIDLAEPGEDEARVLSEVFRFHELAVEDALSAAHHPKIETYDGYLYLILHGIDFRLAESEFATHDTDFFLGQNYLVTVHDGTTRTISTVRDIALRNPLVMGEGAPALLHRIVDLMVEHYRPEVEKLEERIDAVEEEVFERPEPEVIRRIIDIRHDVGSLRRVTIPERDVVGRLARREFPQIDTEIAYRFRDVYDQLVRMSDEALIFQDRTTTILEAHVSSISNRLSEVMKVLTVISTIFMPLTVLTGFYGMNVDLPFLPGGPGAQKLWIAGMMVSLAAGMLALFRHKRWI